MKNINNSTEQKLKLRLKEHEFDFDPQAWSSLNKKLNQNNPRRSPLWMSSLVILTVAVTMLSVAWYVPFEPIKEFLEKTFDFKAEVKEEEPVRAKAIYLEEQTEEVDFQEQIPLEGTTPTNPNINTPVAPLPQMNLTDLWKLEEEKLNTEIAIAKPIAVMSTLLENEEVITQVHLPLKKKVRAGFFGGGTVAVSGSALIPQGAVSPGIGVFVGYNINDKWSVQAEVNFRKGFVQPFTTKEEKDNALILPNTITAAVTSFDRIAANQEVIARNLTVLEFPILAKYKVNEKSSVMAGVRPSWIHVKDSNSDNNSTETRHSPIYEKIDLGVSVGYELQLSERVAVDIRYNKGLTKLFREDEDSTDFNNDFQASVRYTLNP
jgi:hypothetical protein